MVKTTSANRSHALRTRRVKMGTIKPAQSSYCNYSYVKHY